MNAAELMNATELIDCYLVLGLPSGSEGAKLSQKEIKEAFVSKCSELLLRRTNGDPNTDKELEQVERSYLTLKDCKLRREYHHHLAIIGMEKLKLETSEASGSSSRPQEKKWKKRTSKKNPPNPSSNWPEDGTVIHLLHEFACGYALFYAYKFTDGDTRNFESAEKYTLSEPLMLEAFHPFLSIDDSLVEMNAISNSKVTEQLKSFLLKNLPKPGNSNDYVATWDPWLAHGIKKATGFLVCAGVRFENVMRALRMNIDKLVGLHPGHLEQAQLNLARLYSKQRCTTKYVKSSGVSYTLEVAVEPHNRFEGLFIAKGREDIICTKNLVCGEALRGEDLISVQNEDGTKVEYRVWDPSKSKLAAAILCGVTNIWVKPGSRVLYLGDVRGITVSQLSDLVGSDGLVYVVGFCHDLVKIAEKRSNVVIIFENPSICTRYRMVVGMVNVIFAEMVASHEVNDLVKNARFYLETGGHYMITTQARNTNLTSLDLFADHQRREFKQIELVKLELIEGAYVMAVGDFRMPED